MSKPKATPGKAVLNYMALVRCPTTGTSVWANSCRGGLRCTRCGNTGHDKVYK